MLTKSAMHDWSGGTSATVRNLVAGVWDLAAVFLLFDMDRWANLLAGWMGRDPLDVPVLLVAGVDVLAILAVMLAGRFLLMLLERSPALADLLSRPLAPRWRWLFGTLDPWASFRGFAAFLVTVALVLGIAGEVLSRVGILPGPTLGDEGTLPWALVALAAIVLAIFAARRAARPRHGVGEPAGHDA